MSKKKKRKQQAARDKPRMRSIAFLNDWDNRTLNCLGYTRLSDNPEVITAVDTIARLIGSMTIHLMENREDGDVRIKNELSRKIDINPYSKMTRSNFVYWIVKTMILAGNGNAVVWPETSGGIIRDLKPVPPEMVSFIPYGLWNYRVMVAGTEYESDEVLHFALNPDSYYTWMGSGYHVALSDVANNLKQAAATEKGFMSTEYKPSLIVKIDASIDAFDSPEGRQALLDDYIKTSNAGEPWVIPAEQIQIEQVKPLTLSDLALADFVTLDKKTVAAVLGVPPFVLGVENFNRDEWNNFVNTRIMPMARVIEQELTKKLIYGNNWFFRFNSWSLYSYSVTELVSAGAEMVDRMALRRNEWRGWLNLPPDEDMNELLALENYIPADRLGDQGKLVQNGGE